MGCLTNRPPQDNEGPTEGAHSTHRLDDTRPRTDSGAHRPTGKATQHRHGTIEQLRTPPKGLSNEDRQGMGDGDREDPTNKIRGTKTRGVGRYLTTTRGTKVQKGEDEVGLSRGR